MTTSDIRRRAKQLPPDDSRRIRALELVAEGERLVRAAAQLCAQAERALLERPDDGRLRVETTVNGA